MVEHLSALGIDLPLEDVSVTDRFLQCDLEHTRQHQRVRTTAGRAPFIDLHSHPLPSYR